VTVEELKERERERERERDRRRKTNKSLNKPAELWNFSHPAPPPPTQRSCYPIFKIHE
jgi:hypothetical protein